MSLTTTLIERLAQANWACTTGGPLTSLNLHAGSVNTAFTEDTLLSSVVESAFPGYRVISGVTAIVAYIAGDGFVHVAFPGGMFEATDGDFQALSQIAIGPITTAGNLTVTATGAALAGSPVSVTVAVLTTDTNAQLATKIVTALTASTPCAAWATFAATANVVTATLKAKAAQDATANLAFANDTSVGLVPQATAKQVYPGYPAGGTFSTQIASGYLTDANNTFLVGGQIVLPLTPINTPGDGAFIVPDFIWGQ